jgi:hypothetical protein
MRLLWRFVTAALVGFLISSLIALASYSLGLWLGRNSDNLLRIIYYSGPFAILLGVATAAQTVRSVGRKGSLLIAVMAGTALGLVYSYFVARFLFAVPAFFVVVMLSCWVPGGISAMLVAADGKRLSVMTGIAVLCLSAIFLTEPLFNAFTQNQLLTVAFITPSDASTNRLAVYPETVGFHTGAEIQAAQNEVFERLRALGYSEGFRVLSLSRQGKGKHSLAILVVRSPITKEVFLPEPDGSTVVYLQQSETWEKKPPEIPTLRRGIEITPQGPADNGEALFAIPDASGISLVGHISGKVSDQSH